MKRVSLNCASFTFSNPYPGQLPDDTGNFYDRMGIVPRGTFEASEQCGSIEIQVTFTIGWVMFHVEHLKHQNDAAPLNIAAVFPFHYRAFV